MIKLVIQEQRLYCNSIYSHLTNPRINVTLDVKNTIRDLDLHLIDGVIKAKGRLIISELSLEAQTPLFLPNCFRLVDLVVQHIHQTHNHCGLSQRLSVFHQFFWTPKIRARLKSLILMRVTCRRQRAKTISKPPPPPLPAERVQWKRPFTTVGVDHTGHFYCRGAFGNRIKLYICLFVCVTTRAVHLEVVDNLATSSFLLCLRRLAAAKGIPSLILSDNHKTFISGKKFLPDLPEDEEVQEFLRDHCIQWKHQTPRSPWMGGHFERFVRTIKTSLSSPIARKLYNQEELTTVVKEVENIVNSRPLTYQANDALDQPLTPSQLLWGRNLLIMPPLLQPDIDSDSTPETRELRHQYFLSSNALDRFRKRWSEEYLTSLHEKHENRCAERPTHHIKPGSLVMIHHEYLHRYEWPLGKAIKVFPEPSGIVRTAEVEEGGRCSLRPVTFLVPLELDCYDEEEGNTYEHGGRR